MYKPFSPTQKNCNRWLPRIGNKANKYGSMQEEYKEDHSKPNYILDYNFSPRLRQAACTGGANNWCFGLLIHDHTSWEIEKNVYGNEDCHTKR